MILECIPDTARWPGWAVFGVFHIFDGLWTRAVLLVRRTDKGRGRQQTLPQLSKVTPFGEGNNSRETRLGERGTAAMFSPDAVHNAFMTSIRRERMAFEMAAAKEKAEEEKRRGKASNYYRREWGASFSTHATLTMLWLTSSTMSTRHLAPDGLHASGVPGIDAQFYPVDSPFGRSAQDKPAYDRTLNAKPAPNQEQDGVDDRSGSTFDLFCFRRLCQLAVSLPDLFQTGEPTLTVVVTQVAVAWR